MISTDFSSKSTLCQYHPPTQWRPRRPSRPRQEHISPVHRLRQRQCQIQRVGHTLNHRLSKLRPHNLDGKKAFTVYKNFMAMIKSTTSNAPPAQILLARFHQLSPRLRLWSEQIALLQDACHRKKRFRCGQCSQSMIPQSLLDVNHISQPKRRPHRYLEPRSVVHPTLPSRIFLTTTFAQAARQLLHHQSPSSRHPTFLTISG